MHPAAYPYGFAGEKHILADRGWLAEHEVAGLTLQDGERHDFLVVEEAALQPFFSAGRSKAVAVVNDVHAAAVLCDEPFELAIDKLGDQPDQRKAHVTNGHEQGRSGDVGIPQIVPGERWDPARNVEPARRQFPAVLPVKCEDFLSLVRDVDLAEFTG